MAEKKQNSHVVFEAADAEKFHHPELTENHPTPHVHGLEEYQEKYKESIQNPTKFWGELARDLITWHKDFSTVRNGTFTHGDMAWFPDGELSPSYNLVDRHAIKNPDSVAIIYEADEPGQGYNLTYGELFRKVCELANVLKELGVKKGDTVAIYMPMIPETVIAFLAVIRLGALHSVVFAGFSSESLRDRVNDADSRIVLTTDEGRRGGKSIGTKKIVDDALKECPNVRNVLVFRRTGAEVPWTKGRDLWWHEECVRQRPYCPPVVLNAEDPMFLLYTSGSTGKPKGVMHTVGGYLVGAGATTRYVFDAHPGDRIGTAGDVGWITGHTYIIYGPLLLGLSTLVFEGTPAYPSFSRYWDIVDKHKITHFYVAPTAIRLLKRAGDQHIHHDLSSLRVLGSVGEPIAPEIWKWYRTKVGKDRCAVVDTYWQTETGSHVIAPLAFGTPTKPGSASFPFFGIEPAIVDPTSGEELHGNDVEGVLCIKSSWPSMARTIWRAHDRFMDVYLKPYPGYYFTGDGAGRDHEGFYWIRGRVDDVVNVSGHRLSTAEIEAALVTYQGVAEAAVVGTADELTGQSVNAFVCLKDDVKGTPQLSKELILQVRKAIGPFAAPKSILIVDDLPKTRSGKIMRRVLRKVLAGEEDQLGDISTLADPSVVETIIQTVHAQRKK